MGTEAIPLSHRGSVNSLALFLLPANKIALQQRDERIPVPKSHFKSGQQASLNIEGTRLPLGAAQNSVNRDHEGGGLNRGVGACLDSRHEVTACQAPGPAQFGGSLG